ncbi:arylamine N-acetyltransferase [Peribacillus saganii]|uniref:arylamine N-acetyltransferase n=1 Tax=Peribacillus saganii TaxID=2303992 RepID=UPI002279B5EF|nr:arylamine N-acetyltransferase [Peribacillus saganii]
MPTVCNAMVSIPGYAKTIIQDTPSGKSSTKVVRYFFVVMCAMAGINPYFKKRIGIGPDEPVTFDNLGRLFEKTAKSFPFENRRIIEGRTGELTPESLANTLLTMSEGGLCYELNPLLVLFLKEYDLKVWMVRGSVYDRLSEGWCATGMTHVAVLVEHKVRFILLILGLAAISRLYLCR